MQPSLIISSVQKPFGYNFILSGILFSEEIEELGVKLNEKIEKDRDRIEVIKLDISEADDLHFKPSRFFNICSFFANQLKTINNRASISLIINSRQESMFPGLDFQNINIETRMNIQARNLATVSKEESVRFLLFSVNLRLLTRALIEKRGIIFICLSFFVLLCLAGMFGAFYARDRLFGFGLFFSGGILAIEGILIIRAFTNFLNRANILKKLVE